MAKKRNEIIITEANILSEGDSPTFSITYSGMKTLFIVYSQIESVDGHFPIYRREGDFKREKVIGIAEGKVDRNRRTYELAIQEANELAKITKNPIIIDRTKPGELEQQARLKLKPLTTKEWVKALTQKPAGVEERLREG